MPIITAFPPPDAPSSACRGAEPAEFYCPGTYAAEDSVGFLLKRVMLSIVQQADLHLEAHGLTSAQWGPLLRLLTAGPSTVVEMARCMQIDAGAMTRLLDRLEKKGLCRRARSTADRRVVNIELTADGKAAAAHVPAVLCKVLNAHLAGFEHDEWRALHGYLRRMLANGDALRGEQTE